MRTVLAIAGAWLVWAFVLAAMYALHGMACAPGGETDEGRRITMFWSLMVGIWAAAILAALLMLWILRRGPSQWPGGVSRKVVAGSWVAALAAMLLTGVPVLFPQACG